MWQGDKTGLERGRGLGEQGRFVGTGSRRGPHTEVGTTGRTEVCKQLGRDLPRAGRVNANTLGWKGPPCQGSRRGGHCGWSSQGLHRGMALSLGLQGHGSRPLMAMGFQLKIREF